MTRRPWLLVLLSLAAVIWAIGGEWASVHAGVRENHLLDALVGLSFFGAGIVAIERRPGNLIGPLMVAYAAAWFVGNWSALGLPAFPTLVLVANQVQAPFLAQITLSYPSGRLRTSLDKVVVYTTYITVLGASAIAAFTFPRRSPACLRAGCPWTPVIVPNAHVFQAALWTLRYLPIALVPLFLSAIWLRWRRASLAERRDLAPLWVATIILAVVYMIGVFGAPDTSDPFAYLLWEIRAVLEIAVPLVFVWGLLSVRLARSAVGDLVVELESPSFPGDLESALSRTLGDPGLTIAYEVGSEDRWVDASGMAVALPQAGEGRGARAATLIERDGAPLAALIHDRALDEGLVRAAGAAAGMAIANERLRAEVRAQLEEVRASRRRIVEAADTARKRVERDLHDGAQQRLVGLSLGLRMLEDRPEIPDDARAEIEGLQLELRSALSELRELARGLHPQILAEEGLGAAIESLAGRSMTPVQVTIESDSRLPEPVEATAYFVVAEALTNVAKYSSASRAAVRVSRQNGSLILDVTDDGVGGASFGGGSGLTGLLDRVAALGGSLDVTSPSGEGTSVHAEIPCT